MKRYIQNENRKQRRNIRKKGRENKGKRDSKEE